MDYMERVTPANMVREYTCKYENMSNEIEKCVRQISNQRLNKYIEYCERIDKNERRNRYQAAEEILFYCKLVAIERMLKN
jgi:hypothetical protein